MNDAERVVGFLKQNGEEQWCNECIADKSGVRSTTSAQMVTKVLVLCSDYRITTGKCRCGRGTDRRQLIGYKGGQPRSALPAASQPPAPTSSNAVLSARVTTLEQRNIGSRG